MGAHTHTHTHTDSLSYKKIKNIILSSLQFVVEFSGGEKEKTKTS